MDDSSQRLTAAENSLRSVLSSGRGAFVDNKGIRWVMHRDVRHYGACIFLFRIFVQDTNNADFEGYLTKKSKWMGGNVKFLHRNTHFVVSSNIHHVPFNRLHRVEWRKRYFILRGSKIFFAKVSWAQANVVSWTTILTVPAFASLGFF